MNWANKIGSYDYILKIMLIGNSGVGKSSLLLRFADDYFNPNFPSTIGIDYKVRTVNINGKTVKLQIWDTAGQERFGRITMSYVRGAMGIIFVYDVTNQNSYNQISKWSLDIANYCNENVHKILIGNKSDLVEQRVIDYDQGLKLANQHQIKFFETSAKDGKSVNDSFMILAKDILQDYVGCVPSNDNNHPTKIDSREINTKKNCCS